MVDAVCEAASVLIKHIVSSSGARATGIWPLVYQVPALRSFTGSEDFTLRGIDSAQKAVKAPGQCRHFFSRHLSENPGHEHTAFGAQ